MNTRAAATVIALVLVVLMAALAMRAGAQEQPAGYLPPDAATLLPPCMTLDECIYPSETADMLRASGAYDTDDLPAPAAILGPVRIFPAWRTCLHCEPSP